MKPFKEIHVMDVYKNPISGSEWLVLGKDEEERMIQIQMLSDHLPPHLNQPMWKRNTDHIFGYRLVQDGRMCGRLGQPQ